MSSESGEDFVFVSSSEGSHTLWTPKRSLPSISGDEDSTSYSSSHVKRVCLSPDSESDPIFLPDTESTDKSAGETFFSDNDQVQVPSKIPPRNDLEEVASLLISTCCDHKCMHFLTVSDVFSARDKVNSLSSNALRQWTIDKMNKNSHEDVSGKIQTKYLVAGNEVCQKAWCSVHEISPACFARLRKSVLKGQKEIEHGNKGKKRSNTRTEGAKAWMTRYFHLVGDKMPHKDQIHLPSWESQKDIYTRYKSDMQLQQIPETEMVALSSFYRIWADDFSNVVIPEVSSIVYWVFVYLLLGG